MSLKILESCDGCGACCLSQESPPGYLMILSLGDDMAMTDDDLKRFNSMPREAMQELREYRERLLAGEGHPNNMICLWFDEQTRKCKHYDLRPDVCRTEVVLNDASCELWRKQYQMA